MEGEVINQKLEWESVILSYLRPHVDWEVLNNKPTLNHVANVKIVDTDASNDVNTDLPESLTLMSTPMTALAWPCVNSSRLPTVKPEIVNRIKDSHEVNMTLPESAPPTIDPSIFAIELETLVMKAFGDMCQMVRLSLVRDRFTAGQDSCALRQHLDSVAPETRIQDIVDRFRVWESHADLEDQGGGTPARDSPFPFI